MPRIVFFHPDLGIGGAERLIVDAALALKRRNHKVTIYTAHHDPNHCFPETVNGSVEVHCHGDWLPKAIGGHCMALCAILRMIFLTLYVRFFLKLEYDVAIVDQVSACIPFLSKNTKVLFYCHYPDLLLTLRKSPVKKLYRYLIDWVESFTTSCADLVLVNSHFTAGVFRKTFPSIQENPSVLYPSLDFSKFDNCVHLSDLGIPKGWEHLFLSINRYERKKNIPLALLAFKDFLDQVRDIEGIEGPKVHLVVAGGYDPKNQENISHYNELLALGTQLGLENQVTFLKSPSEELKVNLLRQCTCLLYTPEGEHFGIVPLEAMYCRAPVIAVNSGGPMESVVDGETGFLTQQNPKAFAEAMKKFLLDDSLRNCLGNAGQERVVGKFSFEKFASDLHAVVMSLVEKKKR